MKKIVVTCAAIAGCFALQAASGVVVAAEAGSQQAKAKHVRHDPMQASAAMAGSAVPVRYDSGCRAKYAPGSVGYHDCLQRLPATALVGGR